MTGSVLTPCFRIQEIRGGSKISDRICIDTVFPCTGDPPGSKIIDRICIDTVFPWAGDLRGE